MEGGIWDHDCITITPFRTGHLYPGVVPTTFSASSGQHSNPAGDSASVQVSGTLGIPSLHTSGGRGISSVQPAGFSLGLQSLAINQNISYYDALYRWRREATVVIGRLGRQAVLPFGHPAS